MSLSQEPIEPRRSNFATLRWDSAWIEPQIRRLAESAAAQSGLSVEEWTERAIRRTCSLPMPAPAHPAVAEPPPPIGAQSFSDLLNAASQLAPDELADAAPLRPVTELPSQPISLTEPMPLPRPLAPQPQDAMRGAPPPTRENNTNLINLVWAGAIAAVLAILLVAVLRDPSLLGRSFADRNRGDDRRIVDLPPPSDLDRMPPTAAINQNGAGFAVIPAPERMAPPLAASSMKPGDLTRSPPSSVPQAPVASTQSVPPAAPVATAPALPPPAPILAMATASPMPNLPPPLPSSAAPPATAMPMPTASPPAAPIATPAAVPPAPNAAPPPSARVTAAPEPAPEIAMRDPAPAPAPASAPRALVEPPGASTSPAVSRFDPPPPPVSEMANAPPVAPAPSPAPAPLPAPAPSASSALASPPPTQNPSDADAAEAAQLVVSLEPAVKAGDHVAEYRLGILYALGKGVPRDYDRAANLMHRAAEAGLAEAEYDYGVLCDKGLGVPKNSAEAARWYAKAATKGHPPAALNLGYAYAEGQGVTRNLPEAAKWFRRAAEAGLVNAQFNLAYMYEQGAGVSRSTIDAYAWYSLAALKGDHGAQDAVDRLGPGMSAKEQADAKARINSIKRSLKG